MSIVLDEGMAKLGALSKCVIKIPIKNYFIAKKEGEGRKHEEKKGGKEGERDRYKRRERQKWEREGGREKAGDRESESESGFEVWENQNQSTSNNTLLLQSQAKDMMKTFFFISKSKH